MMAPQHRCVLIPSPVLVCLDAIQINITGIGCGRTIPVFDIHSGQLDIPDVRPIEGPLPIVVTEGRFFSRFIPVWILSVKDVPTSLCVLTGNDLPIFPQRNHREADRVDCLYRQIVPVNEERPITVSFLSDADARDGEGIVTEGVDCVEENSFTSAGTHSFSGYQ